MGAVRKSNSYQQIADATRRQRRETTGSKGRLLTLLVACLIVVVASWFAVDHSSAPKSGQERQLALRAAAL